MTSPVDAPDSLNPSPWLLSAEGASRLVEVLASLGAGLAVKQMETGTYVQASRSIDLLFERSESSLVGSTDGELMRADEAQAMRRVELQAMQSGQVLSSEHRLDLGGRRREFSVARVALDSRYLLSVWSEKTQERQREIHLQRALAQIEQHQAEIEALRREVQKGSGRDEATGLQQLGLFNELLEREIDLSTREHREFSLVMVGLDVPEALASDEAAQQRLLEALGRLLRSNTRAMDAASRLDANHFAILLSGVGLATAHARMEQLRRQCAQQIVAYEGRDLGLSVSLGVASFPHSAPNHEKLLAAAQQAIWMAQRRGGNQVGLAAIALGG
jgi:diguanylate cyclase (GGDEF)-like protein